jgi:post-segregation antitoxin (ccd killing protein)
MRKYTKKQSLSVSEEQKETLEKLDKYGYNVSQFIRDAISEKIKKDFPKLIKKENKYSYALKLLNGNNKHLKQC